MRRFSEISGLAVVMRQTGRRIGKVERIAPSRDGQCVEGLILLAHGGLRKKRFVPLGSIALWGEVAVAVTSVQPLAQELRRRAELPGLPVLDTAGQRLGWVTDAFLEEESGCIRSLEVSRGIADDFLTGRFLVSDFTLRPDGVVAVTEFAGDGADPPPARSR